MTTMLWVLLFAATKVYRCETADEIVFQQAPCAMADEPVALKPDSSFGGSVALESKPRNTNGMRRSSSGGKRTASTNACDVARGKRDAAYAERGNRMGFDERRALQDRMDEACGLR